MGKGYCVLYNPQAGGCNDKARLKLKNSMPQNNIRFCDITTIDDYRAFFDQLGATETLIIAGGDGTLNRFINDTSGCPKPTPIYYYACGNGNDFWLDIGCHKGDKPMNITRYLNALPVVTVNGQEYQFLNAVGYGIDGYCCQEGDRLRQNGKHHVNYTAIAIKGLMTGFHPVNATITVDGVRHSYKKVWLAPTMNGRYYGGGMMPAPAQSRLKAQNTVSTAVIHNVGRLKALCCFSSIFKGTHVRYKEMVEVFSGHHITVSFDRPTPLQIDGETILNVSSYEVIK